MNKFCLYLLFALTLTSCATHKGVGRIKTYDFGHPDIPQAFDNYRIAFISDLHYKSRFTAKRLNNLVATLNALEADLLVMGGDYHEGCEYVPELFEKIGSVHPPDGIYAVLGNNDYEACHDDVLQAMQRNGIGLLEHCIDTLHRAGERLLLMGVHNPFEPDADGDLPTPPPADDDFVILAVHTPDYVERARPPRVDLALAGHTHGGQVTLFGLYAPVLPSRYGQRFRTGLCHTTAGVPVIVTNGVGTSRMKLRMFAPSEIVVVRLLRKAK